MQLKMIVSHRYKFIFIKTHKTAGTSTVIALSSLCGPEDIIVPIMLNDEALREQKPRNYDLQGDWYVRWEQTIFRALGRKTRPALYSHAPAWRIRRTLGNEIWENYFKFTIERNPWDRHVSRFFWKTRNIEDKPAFETYVRLLPRDSKASNFRLYALNGEIAVDFVCRYENLEGDLREALRRVGVETAPPLPHAKGNIRKDRRHWREFYTPETRDIVAKVNAREIEEFGYEFA